MIAYSQGFAVNWFTQFNTWQKLFLMGGSEIMRSELVSYPERDCNRLDLWGL